MRRDSRRFVLKQKPLTYTSSIAAESDMPDTLTVLVNQVPWHQVSSLHDLSSDRRAYIVRHDSQGNASLIFGNGDQGAHLPSGREHITATYRIGSGEVGNVPANSLTILRTRPPGIQKVTNPIPASGGVDPEPLDMARINAPQHVQTLQRIVSLNDYESFARIFAGISKVQVKPLWNGRVHLVYMTVAGEAGREIGRDSELYSGLRDAITAAVVSPAQPVYIDSFEPLYFQLKATLVISADYVVLMNTIVANVRKELTTSFGFDGREFGQPISVSEVISVMQHVPGIVAVKLESLYIKGQSEVLNTVLEAKPGQLEAGTLLPAQLLLINAEDEQGIILRVETSGV